jgi:DNA-binding PadR family transcriptional regulator
MNHRHHGCGPRGRVEINLPEALFAMRGGRGWQGGWGPFRFDIGDENWSGRRGRRGRRMFEYAPSPGVVYPTLTLLQDMGLIEEAPGDGPRKPFQVTDEGRKHLEERSEEVEALFERLRDLAPSEHPSAGPAIGRAVKNLMTALSHRVRQDGLNDELLHEIAGILDEAAQKVERVKPTSGE